IPTPNAASVVVRVSSSISRVPAVSALNVLSNVAVVKSLVFTAKNIPVPIQTMVSNSVKNKKSNASTQFWKNNSVAIMKKL
ncbi:MAG: hypothetical protein ACD_27C00046G0001, partial [uncultured bacterium]